MKERKHHTYEKALERIEQMREATDPDEIVNVSDYIEQVQVADIKEATKATKMMLKKYGIRYREETTW